MKFIKDSRPKKIAVFRALQLGDMMCSIPAIRAIKRTFPESAMTLIGLPWAASFVERFNEYFTDFIPFPGYPGLPEQAYDTNAFIEFLKTVSEENFDLLIQMHGNGSIINPIVSLFNSKHTAGYYIPGTYCPDESLFIPYPEYGSEIKRHTSLATALGAEIEDESLELPIYDFEKEEYRKLSQELNLVENKYVCIHAGARDVRRWWGAEKFAFIADLICDKGYKIVLTGSEVDVESVQMVEGKMKSQCVNLVGKTDLGTLALLINNSKMLLSNDTGVSHIAAAMKTPSVVIFLTSDPERWAPLNRNLHKVIVPEDAQDPEKVLMATEQVLA